MNTMGYVYWKCEKAWLGYSREFPDYWTQGGTFEELQENLKDLHADLASGRIPEVGKVPHPPHL